MMYFKVNHILRELIADLGVYKTNAGTVLSRTKKKNNSLLCPYVSSLYLSAKALNLQNQKITKVD